MHKPEVWFAIPSANPDNCRRNLPVWREMGYKIAILQNRTRADIPADIVQWSDSYPGWCASINTLFREIVPSSASLIVSGGDDMLPDPKHSAEELARQFFDRFPDTFGVMQPHGDEYMNARQYCGSPFIGRAFAAEMYNGRGALSEAYYHCFGDVELYWVARGVNALWERPDLSHFHAHFSRDNRPQPAFHKIVENRMGHDALIYLQRAALRFPGHASSNPRRPRLDESLITQDTLKLALENLEWRVRPGAAPAAPSQDLAEQVTLAALERCAKENLGPVALFGSGRHTQRLGSILMNPPTKVMAIIDDNPQRQGGYLWGYPIVSRTAALAMGVSTIVLSSDAMEQAMWDSTAELRASGIRVIRLYSPADESSPEAAHAA